MSRFRRYYDEVPKQATREERENLFKDKPVHMSAFNPRNIEKLSKRKPPKTITSIEMNHKLRTDVPESTPIRNSLPYGMWQESGNRSPPIPNRYDTKYNSNVWRNFRLEKGVKLDCRGRNISEDIATMYPMRIPPQSEMNFYTWRKFIDETPSLIQNPNRKTKAVIKAQSDLYEFKKLKIRSEMRVPPMNQHGNIVPPENFKSYEYRPVMSPETTTQYLRELSEMERDIDKNFLGIRNKPHYPRVWKLTLANNNPEYKQVRQETLDRTSGKKPKPAIYL